jgi:transcriptional regulator with XRE-family HTH domain
MADLLNLSRSTYTHYENNTRQPDLGIVTRIAEILDVSIDFLTGRSSQRIQAGQLISYLESRSKSNPDLKLSDLDLDSFNDKIND